jgi:hypothetical protein
VTKITEANTGKNITVQITNTKEKDAATSNTVDTPQINKEDQNYLNPDNESVSVYSPGAFKFRYAAIKPETIKLVLIGGEEIPLADGISQNTDTLDNQVTYLNELKKRLNAGVIQPFNKECDMFEGLKSNSPFLYDKLIEKLAPFGVGNSKPLFLFEKIEIDKVRNFGKENNHLEIIFKNSRGQDIKAIGFFMKVSDFHAPRSLGEVGSAHELKVGDVINLLANFEKSTFRGFTELRLRIVDVEIML